MINTIIKININQMQAFYLKIQNKKKFGNLLFE